LTTILVVEDEPLIALFIRDVLEEAGFGVESAATANEARQRFKMNGADFHAAIIDVGLPDHPGDELVQEFRRARPDFPIIIATGLAEQVFAERFANVTKLRIIGKPYDGPALLSVLASVDVHSGVQHRIAEPTNRS
jgi:DNA-binding response OmpR family regulator